MGNLAGNLNRLKVQWRYETDYYSEKFRRINLNLLLIREKCQISKLK